VEVSGLCFDYHGRRALAGIDFRLEAGERVALVGPNGAGKSTLLLHLNGLLRATEGEVHILGARVQKSNLADIRKKVGLVFSDPEDQLFMPTLEEDVAFGPLNMGRTPEEARRLAGDALRAMNLIHLKDRSPHHLSDGERRRAAMATVLSMRPAIWVLDEPAANLDPRSRRELIGILNELEGTLVLASHDLDLVVQVCNRCLLLDAGELVADGDVRRLLADEELMEAHGLEVPWRLTVAGKDGVPDDEAHLPRDLAGLGRAGSGK
jgi:cobalt transport protein ATP-binding subunit